MTPDHLLAVCREIDHQPFHGSNGYTLVGVGRRLLHISLTSDGEAQMRPVMSSSPRPMFSTSDPLELLVWLKEHFK